MSENGEYERAEEYYRRSIELDPAQFKSYRWLVISLLEQKKYDEAEKITQRILRSNSKDVNAYFLLAYIFELRNEFDRADQVYKKALNLDGNNINTLIYYGMFLLNKKEAFREAEPYFEKAILLDENCFAGYVGLGDVYYYASQYQKSEAAFRKAIELDANDPYLYESLFRLYRFKMDGKLVETVPLLEKMVGLRPEDHTNYLSLVSVYKELNLDFPKEHIDKINKFIPEDNWYDHACLESICDNFELAFEYLRKAAQGDNFDSKWAWDDPDLQWIRSDPRFLEIVGPKPV